jgi:ubiquinone/menaquinone biosynthesis C-methylase UbiE
MPDIVDGFDPLETYDNGAREYAAVSDSYWSYVALRSVERLALQPGERVVDIPCGPGPALALAAEAVGRDGAVVGLDVAPSMVEIARERVAATAFDNITVRVGDMLELDALDQPLDALVCALGVFFVDDMAALTRSFVDLVQPHRGRVSIGVFGEQFFEPMRSFFKSAVAEVSPDLVVIEPWRRTEDETTVRTLFDGCDVDLAVTTDHDRHPLPTAAAWWAIVMGSGLRRTVDASPPDAVEHVHARCDEYIAANHVTELETTTRYAVARRR